MFCNFDTSTEASAPASAFIYLSCYPCGFLIEVDNSISRAMSKTTNFPIKVPIQLEAHMGVYIRATST